MKNNSLVICPLQIMVSFILIVGFQNCKIKDTGPEKTEIYKLDDNQINRSDTNGKKDGLYKEYFDNKQVSIEGFYSGGVKDSIWKYYYENGTILKIESYKKGLLNGNVKLFNNDGSLSDDVNFINDKKEGLHVHYFPNKRVNYSQEYKAGVMSGKFLVYLPSGVLTQQGELKEGKNFGKWYNFNSNGILTKIVIYDSLLPKKYREINLSLNGDTLSNEIKEIK